MRFTEFLIDKFIQEGIRMGARDIGNYSPKKDFTIGFEFEIATSSGGDDEDDDDLRERFYNQWRSNSDMSPESFWNENSSQREILDIIRQFGLKPAYGKPPPTDDDEHGDDRFAVLDSEDMPVYIDEIEDPEDFFELFIPNRYDRWLDSYHEAEMEAMESDFTDYHEYNDNGNGEKPTHTIQQIFEKGLGVDINVFSDRHQESKDSGEWYVEPDGSIDPHGAELVSPAMPLKQGMQTLKKVFSIINRNDDELSTNSSTGLHINVGDFTSEEADSIDLLKFSLTVGENYVLSVFDRQSNSYATSNIKQLVHALRNKTIDQDYKQIIKTLNDTILKSNKRESFANFQKLYSHGFIELRAPGGDSYHEKYDEISNTVNRLVKSLEIAMDPNAYREQYLSKLYKLINADTSADADSNLNTNNRTDAALNSKINGLRESLRKLLGHEVQINLSSVNALLNSYVRVFTILTNKNVSPQAVGRHLITMREIFLKVKGKKLSSENKQSLTKYLQTVDDMDKRYKQFLNSLVI